MPAFGIENDQIGRVAAAHLRATAIAGDQRLGQGELGPRLGNEVVRLVANDETCGSFQRQAFCCLDGAHGLRDAGQRTEAQIFEIGVKGDGGNRLAGEHVEPFGQPGGLLGRGDLGH